MHDTDETSFRTEDAGRYKQFELMNREMSRVITNEHTHTPFSSTYNNRLWRVRCGPSIIIHRQYVSVHHHHRDMTYSPLNVILPPVHDTLT